MNIRKEFESWLNDHPKLGEETIKQYIYAINKAHEPLSSGESELGIIKSVYDIKEVNKLTQLKNEFAKNGPYHEYNKRHGNQATSAALGKYIEFLSSIEIGSEASRGENNINNRKAPLNQILFGPPGTGKTYNTINKALQIIFEAANGDEKEELEAVLSNLKNQVSGARDEAKRLYDEYVESRQIEFVTFHQSYGYEEFVEGIKPSLEEDEATSQDLTYRISSGVFKSLAEYAQDIEVEISSSYDFKENVNIWKISLGNSLISSEDYIFDYCIKNNKVLLGFGDGIDFSGCESRKAIAQKLGDEVAYSYPPTAIDTFKNKMKQGDIVIVSYGNLATRSVGKITGEYHLLNDESLDSYTQARDVEWLLIPEKPFSYEKLLNKRFSQMTVYNIKSSVKLDDLRELLSDKKTSSKKEDKNYVLVIDEINRGNISKIFGELITLIEPSKRLGADEELVVTLPYSNEPFGVPSNLYIIGTMNTADRSIALMDTALRRRFEFVEMMPKPELLKYQDSGKEIEISKYKNGDEAKPAINLRELLTVINQRITYLYDRDHQIGHAYLMGIKDKDGLDNAFRNKIIPLLQEYFYDDWEKIQLVLGDHPKQMKEYDSNDGISDDDCFIKSKSQSAKSVFGVSVNDLEDKTNEFFINFKESEGFSLNSYLKITGDFELKKSAENEEKPSDASGANSDEQ